ncbi:coenzyme F420-0:L-glutamate ligase [Patescibacteria group bacterium]|nr:coenzyme F420-0:L-glutamate ligase [Patescibacteria group bacterium]
MNLLPIHTPLLKEGDDLVAILTNNVEFKDGDILAISSKAIATAEGAAIDLGNIEVSKEAEELSEHCGKTPVLRQAMLNETKRLHGKVVGKCEHAVLTEVKPDGLTEGTIMAASAGLDQSNIPEGFTIGWPLDPLKSIKNLRTELKEKTGSDIALLITDSCCRPRRIGVTAIALVVSGFDPLEDMRGKKDLFGRKMTMTQEARADQLATAANLIMGNTDASIPAVIIRDHNIPLSDFEGWVPGLDPEDDLFHGII